MDETTAQKLTEEIKRRIIAEQTVDDLKKQLQNERQRASRAMIETLSKSENERAKRQTAEQNVAELTDLLKKENIKLEGLKKLAEDAIKKLQKENHHSRISAEQKVKKVLTLLKNKNDELIELKKDLLQERKFINEITLIIENEHREHQEDGQVLEVKSEAMLSNIFSSSFELKPIDTSFEKTLRASNNRIYDEEQKILLTKRDANRVDTAIKHDISQAQQNFVNTYKRMLAEEIKKRSAQNNIENLLQLLEDEINKVEKLKLVVMRKSKLLTKTLTMLKNKEANRQANTVQIHDAATQFCKEKRRKESSFIDNQRREESLKLVEDAMDKSKEKLQISSTADQLAETEIGELLRLFRMKIAMNKGNESYIQDSSCIRVLESLLKMRSNKDDASDVELEINNVETNKLLQEHAGKTTKKN